MPVDTFASFGRRLSALERALTDPELRAVMDDVGKQAQADIDKAARADLGGDLEFSGWPGNPIATERKHPGLGKVEVAPTPRARGVTRVAEQGRNPDGLAALRTGRGGRLQRRAGSRLRKRDGVRVDKWKGTRWNGRTAPKHTWTDAVKVIEAESPRRIARAIDHKLRRIFG